MTQTISARASAGFDHVRFIMVHPSHPGNVGAAARAVKTMGFHELYLVAPRYHAIASHPDAQALASGADDVLAASVELASLEQALEGVTLAFALTARPREIGPPACDIRAAAEKGAAHLEQNAGNRIAIVLGTERAGLSNTQIALCQWVCHIPANPDYSSLNVAAAAQLVAWELRYALATAAALPLLPRTHGALDPGAQPASSESVQALMTHLEEALISTNFLDPEHPKKLMTRMRHLFSRCGLSRDETNMLRGVCTAMIKAAAKNTHP